MWLRSSVLFFIDYAAHQISFLLLVSIVCCGQTAIADLSSYWAMDVSEPTRLAWDSHASRHAVHTGSGFTAPGTIFGEGIQQQAVTGGLSIPASLIQLDGTFCFGVWVRNNGASSVIAKWGANKQFRVRFSGTWDGRPDIFYRLEDGSDRYLIASNVAGNKSQNGDLVLVWVAYNHATGEMSIAANNTSWTTETPPSPFVVGVDGALDIGHITQTTGRGTVVGRMMFWDGYIPTDGERAAIWNSGSGRDYTYFNPSGFTPPTPVLSNVTYEGVMVEDANLGLQQGLYWFRPYPLKTWSPSLAAIHGDYIYFRSTDHGPGGIYMGHSSSPGTAPPTWTEPVTAATLSADDPSRNWEALELPYAEWDTENSRLNLYFKARNVSTPTLRSTHMYSSSDLSTWTYRGEVFPTATGRNYAGYSIVKRRGPGDWIANTLLTDSAAAVPALSGFWTSTDGVTWTLVQEETATAEDIFSNVRIPYGQYSRTERHGDAGDSLTALNVTATRATGTDWVLSYPPQAMFQHDGTGTGGDWLQDVKAYCEGQNCWIYAKWSYQEPSEIRLYTATLTNYTPPEPTGLQLSDRRPLGAMFIADGTKTSTNPRGYNVGGSPDFLGAGFATAKAALIAKVGTFLDNADLYSPRPQAVMIWDLDGQEFQHIFTYVGAPQALAITSPEMDAMADDLMAYIRSRGYEPGITLRPHRFSSGAGRPTGACLSQGASDGQAYIDTTASYPNRGYRCGPGTVTFPSGSTVQVSGAFAVNYQSGSVVRFVSTGTLPSPLVSLQNYYLCAWNNGAQTFTVATDSGCSSVIASYTGGSGTHTMMSWRGPVDIPVQELPADLADAYNHLKSKIQYARDRWGIRYFYVDSTYYCSNAACQTNTVLPNTGFWDLLHADFPDTVFMPENTPSGPDTAKYLSFNNGEYKPAGANLVIPHIQSTTPGYATWRTEIQAEIAKGTPYMVTLNTAPSGGNAEDLYRQDLLAAQTANRDITMADGSKTRVFRADPGRTYRFPMVARVYFADTANNLAASTTYCTRRATDSCYLGGVLQPTAALDLSTTPYWQLRYYDFAGNLVSNPGSYGTIQ